MKIKGCPVCWGKKWICVGLTEDLKPVTEPCPGCDGTGWIAYKEVERGSLNRMGRN